MSQIKVLVIDDDEEINQLIRRQLRNHRLDTMIKSSGLDVLDLVLHIPIDVFVIDINLKDCNGMQLGKMLRGYLKRDVPIVYISQDKTLMFGDQHIREPNVSFVAKPLNCKLLEERILSVYEKLYPTENLVA